jgi:glycosyltransferase involved in cell wall biosynthesis
MDKAIADSRTKLAFITSGLYFDPTDQQARAMYSALSAHAEGDIYCVVYDRSFRGQQIGDFRVRALALPSWLGGYNAVRGAVRAVAYIVYVLWRMIATRLSGRRPYDLLVATDPFKSGLLAWIGSRLLGIPFAIEVNGNYSSAMRLADATAEPWFVRAKAAIARKITPAVLRRASAIKLLYDTQLADVTEGQIDAEVHVFHALVPLHPFKHEPHDEHYILLLGHPWYLKGADLLIQAFRQVADSYPDWHLRIVGYCPDPQQFVESAGDHPRIHLMPVGVHYSRAIELINQCGVFVLPSRTEGMGRVLLEAMAAHKPVVGARVDGIPRVIAHERTGLLFECGNASDLAKQLDRLLGDSEFAQKLASAGNRDVHERLSPQAFADAYGAFIRSAARSNSRDRAASTSADGHTPS